ncbi:JmjC domain-containing protein [Kribbella sp. NPDC020789]
MELKREGRAVRERVWTQRQGSPSLVIPDSVSVDALAAEFAKGATLILNHIDDFDAPSRAVADELHALLGAPVKAVAFITPPGTQGLGGHFDTFEGFIVQTHGTKSWTVYEQVRPLPNRPAGYRDNHIPTEVALEVTLHPGDCLYVPWGAPHHASTTDELSCHVTFMAYPPQWRDFVNHIVAQEMPPELADSVPLLGTLGDPDPRDAEARLQEIGKIIGALDLGASLREFLRNRAQPTRPQAAGFVAAASRAAKVAPASRVSRNPAVPVVVEPGEADQVTVRVGHVRARVPAIALPALAELQTAHSTVLSDCRHGLSDSALLDVARLLIRETALIVD